MIFILIDGIQNPKGFYEHFSSTGITFLQNTSVSLARIIPLSLASAPYLYITSTMQCEYLVASLGHIV